LGLSRAESENLIEEVVFKLHDTFKNPKRTVKKWPYRFKTNGWGTFDLPIIIKWKDHLKMEDLKLEHYVSFDTENNGKSNVYALKIKIPQSMKKELPKVGRKKSGEIMTKAKHDAPVWR
jgi:YEATS domain-containing protein 4